MQILGSTCNVESSDISMLYSNSTINEVNRKRYTSYNNKKYVDLLSFIKIGSQRG